MSGSGNRSRFVSVKNGQVYVEQAGAGPDVLLVHSGITDSGMWDGQFDAIAERFCVTRYDLRGFGQSSPIDREYTHVDDLDFVIGELGLERPSVLAASMGARVVIDLALRSPERFSRMVLEGPVVSGHGFDDPALHACWQEMGAAWDSGDIEGAIDIETRFWINGPGREGDGANPDVLDHVQRMQRRLVELQPAHDPETSEPVAASEQLEQLRMPVLVIVGQHDVSDIQGNARAIRERAANACLVYLPGTGHLPNMELPTEFNRVVLDFLG